MYAALFACSLAADICFATISPSHFANVGACLAQERGLTIGAAQAIKQGMFPMADDYSLTMCCSEEKFNAQNVKSPVCVNGKQKL